MKRFLLLILTVFLSLTAMKAQEAYAVRNSSTLTFYCDNLRSTRTGQTFDLNTGRNQPGWYYLLQENIQKAVFDPSFANARPTSTYCWFGHNSDNYLLKEIVGIEYLNTESVTIMESMFSYNCNLTSLDVSHFNTSKVTNMSAMFIDCGKLSTLDVSKFNTENVTNMKSMFLGCSTLTSLDVSKFNTENVTIMSSMFCRCSGLTSLDVTHFVTSKVTHMDGMFWGCSSLTSLDVTNFDTSSVTDMQYLFSGCSSLTSLNLSSLNTNNVLTMSYMFRDCSSLASLDLSNFNTINVKDMQYMFSGCSSLTSLNLSSFNTCNVTRMSDMFRECRSLSVLDLSPLNLEIVRETSNMFYDCSSLTTIYCSEKWKTNKITSSANMFLNCTNLVGGMGTKYDVNHVDKAYAHIDGGASDPGYLTDKNSLQSNEAYAVYTDDGTLTFYYDNQKSSRSGTIYGMNTGSSDPGWYTDHQADIKKAVFDSSFAGARPTSTYHWFASINKSILAEIVGIEYLNTSEVTNMSGMFSNCSGLKNLDVSHFNTSKVTDMDSMFSGCSGLTSLDITHFDTSNVTDMGNLFSVCSSLTSLDVKHFDTSNVTDMGNMFSLCGGLTSLDVTHFDTSKVTDMRYMFYGCSALTSLDVTHFDTSNVTGMNEMFYGCSTLTSLDVTHFDTSNVTGMICMFSYCSGLTSLDVTHFDTSKVTDMNFMFDGCSRLTSLDVTHFDTSKVTGLRGMFQSCNGLTSLDVTHFDTSKVTDMSWMFYDCSGLTSLDLSNFDTSNVTNMGYTWRESGMFQDCTNLTTIYVGEGWNTDKVSQSANMFFNCKSLVGGMGTKYDVNHVDKEYAHIDGGASNPGYLTDKNALQPQEAYAVYTDDGTLTFYYDNQRSTREGTTYDLNIGTNKPQWSKNAKKVIFDASFTNARPTTMYYWFYKFTALEEILGIENLNTSQVTSMASLFYDCNMLKKIDVSHFDTSNVTDMSNMFWYCSSLWKLDVSSFNTGKVTNMNGMFQYCRAVLVLDLNSFETSNVKYMTNMFAYCNALNTIYVSEGWNTSQLSSPQNMFSYCGNLKGGAGTIYDSNNIDSSYAHIDGGSNSPGYLTRSGEIRNEAYALLNEETLTFYCDKLLLEREGTAFNINITTGWQYYGFSKVVFDKSFSSARPTRTSAWFGKCPSIYEFTGMEYLNTSQVTDMSDMFLDCRGLTSLDVSHFDTSNVTSMGGMFYGCSSLTSLDVTHFDTSKVTNMSSMFSDCSGLTSLDVSHFDTSNVTSMSYMFYGCSDLTSLDLSHFDTSKVTNMLSMFDGCGLTSLDLSHFDTSTVTNMNGMFDKCSGLTSLDISHFDTSNVTNMGFMFNGCSSLTSLDLSHFDTSKVTNMGFMFQECSGLTTIYVGEGWNTDKITSSENMFFLCNNLVGGAGTVYDINHTDASYAHIDGGASNPGYLTGKNVQAPVSDSDDLQDFINGLGDNKGTEDDPVDVPVDPNGLTIDNDVDIVDDLQLAINGNDTENKVHVCFWSGFFNIGQNSSLSFKNVVFASKDDAAAMQQRAAGNGGGIKNGGTLKFANCTFLPEDYTMENSSNTYIGVNVTGCRLINKTGGRINITSPLTDDLTIAVPTEADVEPDVAIVTGVSNTDHILMSLPSGYAYKYDATAGGIVVYSTTGITAVGQQTTVKDSYDTTGRKVGNNRKGLHIQRMSDGTVRKVMINN